MAFRRAAHVSAGPTRVRFARGQCFQGPPVFGVRITDGATVPLARCGVPQGSQLSCCCYRQESQGCSILRGCDPASKGPLTGQGGPKRLLGWPKRAPNRSKIAPRRPRWPPDGTIGLQDAPRSLQDGPRGLQEVLQEGPKRPKSLIFLRFLKDFGLLEASLGSSLASWSRLEAVLGPLGASSEPS